jgi:hypothetical protein
MTEEVMLEEPADTDIHVNEKPSRQEECHSSTVSLATGLIIADQRRNDAPLFATPTIQAIPRRSDSNATS